MILLGATFSLGFHSSWTASSSGGPGLAVESASLDYFSPGANSYLAYSAGLNGFHLLVGS